MAARNCCARSPTRCDCRPLRAIKDVEHSVGEIQEIFGIGQPGLLQQLAVLRKADLVFTRRKVKQIFNVVDRERVIGASELLNASAGTTAATPPPHR